MADLEGFFEEYALEDSQAKDRELNLDYMTKPQATASIAADITGGVAASVVDFGATVFNALPFVEDVNTYDLLAKTNDNAARVYAEHPDTIKTASFVGGIFVPGSLGLKGMNLLRSGSKATNWFSTASKERKLEEVNRLAREAPELGPAFKQAKTNLFVHQALDDIADTVAMEAAIGLTTYKHPYMESYVEDPLSSIGIGLAVGGVFGVGIGHIASRALVKSSLGAAQTQAMDQVLSGRIDIFEALPQVNKIQLRQKNIENLQMMIDKGAVATDIGPSKLSNLAQSFAKDLLIVEQAAQSREFQELAKAVVDSAPVEFVQDLKQKLISDPRFVGTDAVRLLKLSEDKTISKTPKASEVGSSFSFFKTKVDKTTGEKKEVLQSVVYYPEWDRFGPASAASELSRASAIKGVNEASVRKHTALSKTAIQVPNLEVSFSMMQKSSASVDKMYLDALAYVDDLDDKLLAKAVVDPDDLPMIQALLARASKESATDPTFLNSFKVKLTKQEPNYDGPKFKEALSKLGVRSTYQEDLARNLGSKGIRNFSIRSAADISADTKALIEGWIYGNASATTELRKSADDYFRGGYGNLGTAGPINEIYNSLASKKLRAEFAKHADSEGYVYLWRGLNQEPRGQFSIESYTTLKSKAAEFAEYSSGIKLFRIKVDDIIAGMNDMGSDEGPEIWVAASSRQAEARLPVLGSRDGQLVSTFTAQVGSQIDINAAELMNHMIQKKEDMIRAMVNQGRSFEEIAIKTNTPLKTVVAYVSDGMKQGELVDFSGAFVEYSSASAIGEYLALNKAPMAIRANQRKVPYADMQGKLDADTMNIMQHDIAEGIIRKSQAPLVQSLASYFYEDGMQNALRLVRKEVSEAVEGKQGSRFFQSADFSLRNMKTLGQFASVVGKDIQSIANNAMQRMLSPIGTELTRISDDITMLTEFNTAVALNASLSKWRTYKDRQFWQQIDALQDDGSYAKKLVPVDFQGKPFKVQNDIVDFVLEHLGKIGRELYETSSTKAAVAGRRNLSDLGYWLPAFNPRNKFIAYATDLVTLETKLLWGNTEDELKAAIQAFKPTVADKIARGTYEIIEKGKQADVAAIKGRTDTMEMLAADAEKYHKGSSTPAIVRATSDTITDIVQSLEHYIEASVRDIASIQMYDILDTLEDMEKVTSKFSANQPLNMIQRTIKTKVNPAKSVRNTLLGISDLTDYEGWQSLNKGFEAVMGVALEKTSGAFYDLINSTKKGFFSGKVKTESDLQDALSKVDYKEFADKLETLGVVNPYAAYSDAVATELFKVAKLQDASGLTPRLVYASNALAATTALRFGELAQPMVNAMSLPILTMSAISSKMPDSFLGVKRGTANVNPIQIMHEGVRAMNSPYFASLDERWIKAGYYEPMVSEASKVLKLQRGYEKGVLSSIEKALDSRLVEVMSKPADWSEAQVRRVAMHTGGVLAKKLYPELDDAGVTIFARHFMDRAIGNYHSAQRPVFFQGTLGTAMGLFQTYMVTMAQHMYGHLELRNYKALTRTMLTQQTIFGAYSLPGFGPVSELIGEHYSEDHIDLQTGTFRSLPNEMAKMVLYGIPSSLGPSFYTRGELAPRIPNLASGIIDIPTVNMASQVLTAIGRVGGALMEEDEDIGRATLQALSMQSLSRPLARISELGSGYSVTSQGNTIATPNEVWTVNSLMARAIGTRPLEESILREAIHLNSVYGNVEQEARQSALASLKLAIRNGTLDKSLSNIAEEYMKYGTPTGWRSAVNTAIAQTKVSGAEPLGEKLRPDHALNFMINGLDE